MLLAQSTYVATLLKVVLAPQNTTCVLQGHDVLRPIVQELIDALLELLAQEKFDDVTLSLRVRA